MFTEGFFGEPKMLLLWHCWENPILNVFRYTGLMINNHDETSIAKFSLMKNLHKFES